MNHNYQPTDHFARKLLYIKKTDPKGYTRIQRTIDRLLMAPADADGRMVGLYHGRLKKYVGRRDYRIIYYWCSLCHKENRKNSQNNGRNCDTIPDNSVIFFDLYHKKDKKKIKKHIY